MMAVAFDLEPVVYLVELDLHNLTEALEQVRADGVEVAVSQYPPVVEDLALIVDAGQASAELGAAIAAHALVETAELFDVYEGPPVAEGSKSLAYRVVYRAPDRTLREQDVERVRKGIVSRLAKQFKAQLRDG